MPGHFRFFGGTFVAPGWHELVVYQLHVGTFFDPSSGAAGLIDKLIGQIPHLRDLGIPGKLRRRFHLRERLLLDRMSVG